MERLGEHTNFKQKGRRQDSNQRHSCEATVLTVMHLVAQNLHVSDCFYCPVVIYLHSEKVKTNWRKHHSWRKCHITNASLVYCLLCDGNETIIAFVYLVSFNWMICPVTLHTQYIHRI